MTATNTFLNLVSSDPELRYYETLQGEASTVFKEDGDWADPDALDKLPYVDSAIRETLHESCSYKSDHTRSYESITKKIHTASIK